MNKELEKKIEENKERFATEPYIYRARRCGLYGRNTLHNIEARKQSR